MSEMIIHQESGRKLDDEISLKDMNISENPIGILAPPTVCLHEAQCVQPLYTLRYMTQAA